MPAVACTIDALLFAVLIVLPFSSNSMNNGSKIQGTDGIIALFNAGDPVPVTTWSVTKVISFLLTRVAANFD